MKGEENAPASFSVAGSQGVQAGRGNVQINNWMHKPEIDLAVLHALSTHSAALIEKAGMALPLGDYSLATSPFGTTGVMQRFHESSGREVLVCSFERPTGNRLTFRIRSRTLAHYLALGGVESWLGFPVSDSRRVHHRTWLKEFEGGSIFNRDGHAPVAVPKATLSLIGESDGGTRLGWPESEEEPIGTEAARIQFFEKGAATLRGGRRRILLYL
jgi:hypothetical protein